MDLESISTANLIVLGDQIFCFSLTKYTFHVAIMDPLSISVSILAIIGAISTTIKTGKSVYRAPEELESLINDLTEGEIMVG